MNSEKLEEWSKADFEALAKFFRSQTGKLLYSRIEALRQRELEDATNLTRSKVAMIRNIDADILACVHRASGIDLVLTDLKLGIARGKEQEKKK